MGRLTERQNVYRGVVEVLVVLREFAEAGVDSVVVDFVVGVLCTLLPLGT